MYAMYYSINHPLLEIIHGHYMHMLCLFLTTHVIAKSKTIMLFSTLRMYWIDQATYGKHTRQVHNEQQIYIYVNW